MSSAGEEGRFGKSETISVVIWVVIANAIAWILVAPVLDIVLYSEPANKVFIQGATAFVVDAIVSVIVGIILLKAYSATKTKKGSLAKED